MLKMYFVLPFHVVVMIFDRPQQRILETMKGTGGKLVGSYPDVLIYLQISQTVGRIRGK